MRESSQGQLVMDTLDEISASIPNGFHDAQLLKLVLDYTKREVQLTLDVWIAESLEPEEKEAYRLALLTLYGLHFWVCEAPEEGDPNPSPNGASIDICSMDRIMDANQRKLPSVPPGVFVNWIYVNDWNTYMFVGAETASLTWLGNRTVRHYPGS
jgi:hypothetical protein